MPVLAGPQRSGATAPGIMAAGTVPLGSLASVAAGRSRASSRSAYRFPVRNQAPSAASGSGARRSGRTPSGHAEPPVPGPPSRAVGGDQAAHTPCWPMSQCRSDSSGYWARTRQLVQAVIAAAASRRAWAGSTPTGNHSPGVEAAVRAAGLPNHSGPHKASPVTWRRGRSPATGSASPDDRKREPWRAAAVHQVGAPVPVDAVHIGLGQPRWDPEPGELCHSPLVHQ